MAGITFSLGVDSRAAVRGISRFGKSLDAQTRKVSGLTAQFSKMGTIVTGALSIGAAAGFAKALSAATDFEEGLARVNTILRLNKKELGSLGNEILNVSTQYGLSTEALNDAAFQIVSAGKSGSDAMEILRAASEGAVAGFSDVKEVTAGLLTATEVFGLKGSEAMDLITLANEKGRITTGEFASAVGMAGPIAKALGLDLKDVSLAMAKITQGGVQAAEATTALRGAMRLFGTKEVKDLVGDVRNLGLVEMLERVKSLRNANRDVFEKLFFKEERGKLGILQLIREGGVEIGKLKELNTEVGLTAKQFKEARTEGFKMRQSQERLNKSLIEIGDAALPAFSDVIGTISDTLSENKSNFTELIKTTGTVVTAFVNGAAWINSVIPKNYLKKAQGAFVMAAEKTGFAEKGSYESFARENIFGERGKMADLIDEIRNQRKAMGELIVNIKNSLKLEGLSNEQRLKWEERLLLANKQYIEANEKLNRMNVKYNKATSEAVR